MAEERLQYDRHERRRRLRRKTSQSQYHHVPCSAALDFARTTTPEPLSPGKMHKLARPMMEYYARGSQCGVLRCQSSATKALGIGVVELPNAGSDDRVLRGEIARRSLGGSRYAQLSSFAYNSFNIGDSLSPEYLHRLSSYQRRSVGLQQSINDRPDWTERDECSSLRSSSIPRDAGLSPQKSEGIWALRCGTRKRAGGVTSPDGDLSIEANRESRVSYHWGCACFV